MTRRLIAVVVIAFVAASCGGGDDGEVSEPVSSDSTGTEIIIEFDEGTPVRDVWRQDVPLGDAVTVVVTGDRDEQVHVHGYDLYVDADSGEEPLEFDALIPGRFEIELEESGRLVLEITVS